MAGQLRVDEITDEAGTGSPSFPVGNVGIGTSSPANALDVQTGTHALGHAIFGKSTEGGRLRFRRGHDGAIAASVGFDSATGLNFGITGSTDLFFSAGGSERMRITSAGNVGIGTSSPATSLHVLGSAVVSDRLFLQRASASLNLSIASYWNGSGSPLNGTKGDIVAIGNTGGDGLVFVNSDTERMRIDSSGNLLVGQTSESNTTPGTRLEPAGRWVVVRGTGTGSTTIAAFYRADGGGSAVGAIAMTNTATSYVTSSDYRLKHDIQPMTGALAKVQALKPCTYKWNINDSADEGFIAHELAEVCPSAVSGEKDAVETYTDEDGNEATRPVYQGIDTSFLVATLTAAIQELKAINDAQAQTIESLKARLDAANI